MSRAARCPFDQHNSAIVQQASGIFVRNIRRSLFHDKESVRATIDWPALSAFLSERNEQPRALLCEDLICRMFNRGMVQALGYPVEDAIGRPWTELCVPLGEREGARGLLHDGLRGTTTSCLSQVVTRGGSRVIVELELATLGTGSPSALLVTIRHIAKCEDGAAAAGLDLEYDVTTTGGRAFGDLLRVAFIGSGNASAHAGGKCFTALHQRDTACDDCPVLPGRMADGDGKGKGNGNGASKLAIRRRTAAPAGFETLSAVRLDDTTARLRVRTLPDSLLSTIGASKITAVIKASGLTEREGEVLHALLDGGSLQAIGSTLGLSVRTVKFHQANVLTKVGATSRAELIRLIRF